MRLTIDQADKLFKVLVFFGTPPNMYDEFKQYFTEEETDYWEFRCFQFLLGFGGKLYWDGDKLRASYYPEDQNDKRDKWLSELNRKLSEFQRVHLGC